MLPLGNLGTLGRGIREMGGSALGLARRFNSEFAAVGGYRTLFANRTALGAIGGGIVGAYRGDDYSASRIAGNALAGAGLARYGGAFAKGQMAGMGMRSSARMMSRYARMDGARAGKYIANMAMRTNKGIGSMRGMWNRSWF